MSRKNETINQGRRSFFGAATLTMGAAQLGFINATKGGLNRCQVFFACRKLGYAAGICSAKTD